MKCWSVGAMECFKDTFWSKPRAAVATLWRALVIAITNPKNPAATKALQSRAKSCNPLLLRPPDYGGQVWIRRSPTPPTPFRMSLPGGAL